MTWRYKIKKMFRNLVWYIDDQKTLRGFYFFKIKRYFSFRSFRKKINPNEFNKHCLISGMTGSGKSELLKYLIHFFIYQKKDKGSIILCDPHGDVADEIVSHKYIDHSNIVYFNPLLFKKGNFGINPFGYKLNDDEIEIYAGELALVFEEMIKSSASLTLNMKSLLVPCITVLLKRENSSLKDLLRFMTSNNEDLVELGMKSLNPSIANFFKTNFHDPIYSVTKQSITVKIQSLLNSYTFTKITTSKDTINLEELINQRKIIVFNLSKGLLGSDVSQALGRFIVALTQSIAINRANEEKIKRVATYLFIDEFTNYTTKSVKAILEESRKYNLHLIVATQLLGKNIDPILKESILSNTNVKIIGANSYSQQTALSKETGIEKEKLLDLKVGSFYMKSKFSTSFFYKVPMLFIGLRYKLGSFGLRLFYNNQVEKYYKNNVVDTEFDLKPLFDIEENDIKR